MQEGWPSSKSMQIGAKKKYQAVRYELNDETGVLASSQERRVGCEKEGKEVSC
jgi:16S rRNA C1402 N4-methylase RsmH